MFVRMYVNAINEEVALGFAQKFVNLFDSFLKSISDQVIEPYWKLKGVYQIEIEMQLYREINEKEIKKVLSTIGDNWLTFGDPVNELLISDTTDNCDIKLSDVKMINIHL
jgi:hypothetical protein